jgi:putative DNA primase/helicase
MASISREAILNNIDKRAFYSARLPSLKVRGNDKAMALCPFHQDNTPSLSVNLGSGDFNCFGCDAKGSIFDFYMRLEEVDFRAALAAFAEIAGLAPEQKKRIVKTYDYTDEAGNLLFQVIRYHPKDFRQRTPDGKGGWIWNMNNIRLVPFHLPSVLKADNIIITEGEKDVESLRAWGLVATCNPMGAGKWELQSKTKGEIIRPYNEYFRGKKVLIVPDNDESGRRHSAQVAANLEGIAESVKVVVLPNLPDKGDVSDWLKAGGTKEQLLGFIRSTPEWRPVEEELPGVVCLETVKSEKVEWLWYTYVPLGKITILDGDPGNGKSLFTTDLASRVTSDQLMPDGSKGITGGVVLLAMEDSLADTIVPRIEVAGGDKKKIVSLQGVPDASGDLRFPTVEDVEHIARACKKVNAKLVIIDPLMGYLGTANSWKDQDIRRAMAPLVKMADELNVAVIGVRHLTKAAVSKSMYRGGGSIGLIGLARIGLLIAKDPDNENKRILAGIKSNLAPLPLSLTYAIEDYDGTPKIAWGSTSTHTADSLLSLPLTPEEKTAIDEAKDFILDILVDRPVLANDVIREAKKTGIAEKTLQRAKKVLGVVSKKGQFKEGWKWSLAPEDGQESPKMVNKNDDQLGLNLTAFDIETSKKRDESDVIEVLHVR